MKNQNIENDWEHWLNHKKYFRDNKPKLDHRLIPQSYYFMFDCFENEIIYISDKHQKITGYTKNEFTIIKLLEHIHPDDYKYVLDCETYSLNFSNSLNFNEHFRYSTTYSFRIMNKDGKYIKVRQNYQALEINDEGRMSRSLVFHEIIALNEDRKIDDFKVFDHLTNQYVNINNRYNLTKRELEILELIKLGLTSNNIAEKLFLSKFTVDTHRKNILAKTKSKSFIELT